MNLQDLMMLYGVTLGARRTKKQRYLFGTHMKETLTALGWTYSVQQNPKGKTAQRVENIVVGDPDRAGTIFVAPYDTPVKASLPFRYYPFAPAKTLKEERRDGWLKTALGTGVILVGVLTAAWGLRQGGAWLLLLAVAALLLFLGWRAMKGKPNEVNFNRASASVAVCMKLAEALKDKKNNVAFVFCDKSVSGYEGFKVLGMSLSQNANVVVLDCVAYGETLVLAHGPLANLRAKKLLEKLPQAREKVYTDEALEGNQLSFFPGGMVLTAGKVAGSDLVVEDTLSPRDHMLDLPRLEAIAKALEDYARGR